MKLVRTFSGQDVISSKTFHKNRLKRINKMFNLRCCCELCTFEATTIHARLSPRYLRSRKLYKCNFKYSRVFNKSIYNGADLKNVFMHIIFVVFSYWWIQVICRYLIDTIYLQINVKFYCNHKSSIISTNSSRWQVINFKGFLKLFLFLFYSNFISIYLMS